MENPEKISAIKRNRQSRDSLWGEISLCAKAGACRCFLPDIAGFGSSFNRYKRKRPAFFQNGCDFLGTMWYLKKWYRKTSGLETKSPGYLCSGTLQSVPDFEISGNFYASEFTFC
jgi:hypothetical protein